MSDPYKVLGISRDATDDEVKKAYREKSRIYHPDANVNNPNKDKAEEMFKLIQQAYDQIMHERQYGSSYSGGYNNTYGGGANESGNYNGGFGGYGSFGNFGGFGNRTSNNNQDPHYTAAANYINSGHFQEALNVLNDISERSSMWYYLSAVANNGVGNNVLALDLAKTALQMDPNNYEYERLVQTLESGGQWYNERQHSFGGDRRGGFCCSDPCTTLCLLNLCCRC